MKGKDKPPKIKWDGGANEYLVLVIVEQLQADRVNIPWERVAAQLHPKATASSIKQHLYRLKRIREERGAPLPPGPLCDDDLPQVTEAEKVITTTFEHSSDGVERSTPAHEYSNGSTTPPIKDIEPELSPVTEESTVQNPGWGRLNYWPEAQKSVSEVDHIGNDKKSSAGCPHNNTCTTPSDTTKISSTYANTGVEERSQTLNHAISYTDTPATSWGEAKNNWSADILLDFPGLQNGTFMGQFDASFEADHAGYLPFDNSQPAGFIDGNFGQLPTQGVILAKSPVGQFNFDLHMAHETENEMHSSKDSNVQTYFSFDANDSIMAPYSGIDTTEHLDRPFTAEELKIIDDIIAEHIAREESHLHTGPNENI